MIRKGRKEGRKDGRKEGRKHSTYETEIKVLMAQRETLTTFKT